MIKVGIGQGECIDTLNATRIAIAHCKAQLGGLSPQAGIVFASADFNHQQMLDEIHRNFPKIELAGCTTSGEFSSDYGFSDDSVSLMVFYSDTIEIKAGMGINVSENPESAARNAFRQAVREISQPVSLCLIFPSSYIESPDRIIYTLNKEFGTACPIFGGSAGHQMHSDQQKIHQFFKTSVLQNAVSILIFAGSLEYAFNVNNSWNPVGKKARVTQAKGREVMQIDNMNALDFYHYYLGKHTYPAIEFPLAVYEEDNEHFYLRAVSTYNESNGSISFSEIIPEGATVQLTEAIRDNLIKGTNQSLKTLQACLAAKSDGCINGTFPANFFSCSQSPARSRSQAPAWERNDASVQPIFAIGFSCALRKYILGTKTFEELDMLKAHLPADLPIMGFYGFGEFAPLMRDHSSRFHNATLVTLVVGTTDKHEISASVTSSPVLPVKDESLSEYQIRRKNLFLQKKLMRSEHYRQQLESNKELNAALLRKINQDIEEARQEITEANRKITDSLNYAKMIQQSLLANLDVVKSYLPNSFFIWEPRDIVGGDIFYTESFEDGFIVAVIDCTGHGVPGAFMTMIAVSALKRIIKDEGCHDPGKILKRLNFIVKTTLQQDKDYALSDDGMDAGICFITRNTESGEAEQSLPCELTFASAKIPLYYVSDNELTVIKGDRQSIGYKRSDVNFDYTNHTVHIEKNMCFYMATDGFTDQLGGKNERKFGSARLKKLLREISTKPFDKQRYILVQVFEEHKKGHERQDDMTVVGFGF